MYQNFDTEKPLYTLTIGEYIELNKHILSEFLSKIPQSKHEIANEEPEDILNISQAAKLLFLSVPTIYGLVSKMEIPFFKIPWHKRLYFKRSVLLAWIEESRRKTKKEIENDADLYIIRKRRVK